LKAKGEYETNEIDETNEEILNFFRLVRLFRLFRILSSDLAMSLPWLNVGLPQIWVLLKTGKYRMITPTQLEITFPNKNGEPNDVDLQRILSPDSDCRRSCSPSWHWQRAIAKYRTKSLAAYTG
jgi:hypothetical protein